MTPRVGSRWDELRSLGKETQWGTGREDGTGEEYCDIQSGMKSTNAPAVRQATETAPGEQDFPAVP